MASPTDSGPFFATWTDGIAPASDAIEKWEAGGFGCLDNGPGWAIGMMDDEIGEERLIPMRFGRQHDARLAAAALNRQRAWSRDYQVCRHQVIAFGRDNVRRVLLEAMQW